MNTEAAPREEIIPPDTAPAGTLHPEIAAEETGKANRSALLGKVKLALAANDNIRAENAAYRAIASPTAAQVRDHVAKMINHEDTMTRELSALARIVGNFLDSTAGT